MLTDDSVVIAVQVQGKLRGTIEYTKDGDEYRSARGLWQR